MPCPSRSLLPALLATLLAACGPSGGDSGPPSGTAHLGGGGGPGGTLGGPLTPLSASELDAFQRGKSIFERRFKPSEGLGPFYNATSCQSCHSQPVTGGGARLYRNFFLVRIGPPSSQINVPGLPSPVMPAFGTGYHHEATFTLEGARRHIPEEYLGFPINIGHRNGIPIFGVGLFEAISNATILANTDPNDADGDGISGRFNTDMGAIGRFGVKAQSNNIESFTRAPLMNQLGITSNPFRGSEAIVSLALAPVQVSADPNAPTIDHDGVPDPEISPEDLRDLITFTRLVAPPVKKVFDAAALNGETLFAQTGCTACHIPSLPSARGPVEAYTDLLLHDMGPELADGISLGGPQPSTISPPNTASEFRTQPLWGVSVTGPFLHDGRAETLEEAILLHGGEAAAIRDAFAALPLQDREDILAFLEHL